MSLPCAFQNSEEYFEKCLEFLEKYSWIYETSNTCFIRNKIYENFPPEWIEYFTTVTNDDLNAFPTRQLQTVHSSLNDFLQELNSLIPNKVNRIFPRSIDHKFKKMSKKKQHEISRLSCVIGSICGKDIDVLIDFGSGLGYLSELLHKQHEFKIIGIESDPERVQAANDRQSTAYPSSRKSVFFREQFITEESRGFISNEINTLFPELKDTARLAIIGLHSCADLTINSMKLFFTMENVRKLIIMPCCYHKMEIKTDEGCGFKNFPLSKVLQKATAKKSCFKSFNRPFLRLACQQTYASWVELSEEEHSNHSVDMFFRGVVEAIITDQEKIIKSKRKLKLQQLDFDELTSVYELYSKISSEQLDWTVEHKKRFFEVMEKYPNGPKLAEGLTCLQTSMQELCENVVLYDRLCYMEEQAIEASLAISVKFEKIMDEVLSPRGYVLIAEKL